MVGDVYCDFNAYKDSVDCQVVLDLVIRVVCTVHDVVESSLTLSHIWSSGYCGSVCETINKPDNAYERQEVLETSFIVVISDKIFPIKILLLINRAIFFVLDS